MKKSKLKSKYKIILLLLLISFVISAVNGIGFVVADSTSEIEQNISKSVLDQINKLNFSDLDEIISQIGDSYNIFSDGSFKDKLIDIINGKYFTNFDNIFSAVINFAFGGFVKILPLLLSIIAIALLSNIVSSLKNNSSSGVGDMIHFVCYGVIVLLLVTTFTTIISITNNALNLMGSLMQVVFPILLTLLTAVGAVTSVAIYKPIVAILTGGVGFIFSNVLFPLFIASFVFIVISNISSTVKLNKFNEFISSTFKWVVGFVLTLFSSFLMIQGISAGRFDSVSIKATKFAVKSYVPIIGSFISDGFDFIILSSVLIKNAVGVGVLLLIFSIILVPVIQIVIFKLSLQLLSAVLEPMGNSKIVSFTSSCAKILAYPIAILLGVAFMFLITVALIMTTANVF